jgi:GxxExxY protein
MKIEVYYKGNPVGEGRIGFFVARLLIVELNVAKALAPIHEAQVISNLKAMNRPLGLLINLKVARLHQGIERVVVAHANRTTQVNTAHQAAADDAS